ncbi:MAG: hypothetical protein HYT12_03775 [Candidatus Liptonbacteria bacterium]|nr:hypothetical protein [Candidatus Liptonbacteria bacterium]
MISTKTTSDILNERKKSSYIIWGASVFAVFFIYLIYGMMPADIGSIEEKTVLIKRGFGVSDIADVLQKETGTL